MDNYFKSDFDASYLQGYTRSILMLIFSVRIKLMAKNKFIEKKENLELSHKGLS